jgi:Zn-dependent protease
MSGPTTTGLEGYSHGFGTLLGAPVSVHWTFWFNFVIQLVFAIINYSSSWKYITLICMVWGPFALIVVYLHELGHLFANRKYGGYCTSATLWPLGGFSECYIENCTCMQEFFVALAGPCTHIPQFFIWLIVMGTASQYGVKYYSRPFSIEEFDAGGADEWFAKLAMEMLIFNMLLFFLNLFVPVYPLDAARMLASLCVQCGMSTDRACLVLVVVGGMLGLGCTIYGIIALVGSVGSGLTFLLAGLFLLFTTYSMFRCYNNRRVTSHPLFVADCYKERRTYAGGANGTSRNFTDGRTNAGNSRRHRSDVENGEISPTPRASKSRVSLTPAVQTTVKPKNRESTASNTNNNSNKKMSYDKALKKAKKMKMAELKKECQQRGIYTESFFEKVQFEEGYAKSFSNK